MASFKAREPPARPDTGDHSAEALVTDGFLVPDLGTTNEAPPPPAYGEQHDQMQFSQPGFEAGAAVTDAGRVSISINTKNRRLADLLTPSIESQVVPQSPLPPAYIPPSLGGQPGQDPPPRLNVVIQIVGSRGDVQPFVALGKVLKDTYGHRIRVATHTTFQQFVEENGLEFFNIGGDPAELMAFMVKHPGLNPGFGAIKSGEVTKRRKGISDILLGCWRSCIESGNGLGPPPRPERDGPLDLSNGLPQDDGKEPFVADAIIANPPSFAHIHIAEKLGIPLHMMFTMPWTPTRAFPHPLADINYSNADDVLTKYLSYTLVEMMTWQGLGDVINRFREKALDLPPLSLIWAPGLLNRLKVPYTYCWSPTLIAKPNDWGRHIDVAGFYFLDLATSYTPDAELAAFLEAGPPPIYIGFGSIVVDDPNALTTMIFDAVRQTGVRALVSKGWGGLGANEIDMPEGVFMLGNVPHDWLFQKVAAVVHHGGAGTTAAGIKAGKPTLVVPFFGDQPFWGAMVARAKAGPDPIAYKNLTADGLAEAIQFCLRPDTVERAKEYGEQIREEKGTDVGGQSFHNNLDIQALRCSLAPSRAAAWRVRRSDVRLSPLAAAVLVDEGLLQWTDFKLYRSREYNTEDQPPDPISAAACSLVMDATGIGMAIADMPREMFKSRNKPKSTENVGDQIGSPGQDSPVNSLEQGSDKNDDKRDIDDASTGKTSSTPTMQLPPAQSDQSEGSRTSLADTSSIATTQSGSTERRPSAQKMREALSRRDSSPVGMSIEAAVGAGKSVGKIVSTGVKSPMNFCLGLAKGFRNVPNLYNDETVRPVEKVTGIGSGLKIASKEFGFGLFDGISGLVTQPLRGAEKEGAGGLVKGVGKGIGGLLTKPAAGFWSIPAYTMQGVHVEVTKMFSRSSQNYILTSRIIQGQRDLRSATLEERRDIVARWRGGELNLKGFQALKKKEKTAQKAPEPPYRPPPESSTDVPRPSSGWHSRLSSFDNKSKRDDKKDALLKGFGTTASGSGSLVRPNSAEDAEFERAIQASVRETSRGNAEEDARIEAAIRQSVMAVRQQGELPTPVPTSKEKDIKGHNIFEDSEYQITDEEYQALIEQALQESLTGHSSGIPLPQHAGISELEAAPSRHTVGHGGAHGHDEDEEEHLKQAIEQSKKPYAMASGQALDDDEFERAIAASKEDMQREQSQRTEEDIVMEYVKKQSLAEAEYRRQKGISSGRNPAADEGEDDDDLRRALEESLIMSRGDDSGPSKTRGS